MTSFLGHRTGVVGRFRNDASGNVAVVFALMAVVLMLAIGAAVDVGRWLHARDQTVSAVDAAVLAGGRALQTNSTDQSAAVAAADKYYKENVTSRLPVVNDTVSFAVRGDGMGMTASGSAFIKTPFLRFASIDKLPLISSSQTEFSKSEIAIGGKGDGNTIEVALMLDVTGSMDGSKLDALKDALIGESRNCNDAPNALICIIFSSSKNDNVRVSVVPFSEDIRLPSTALKAARGTGLASSKTLGSGSNKATYYLTPCVVERKGATYRYTDTGPAANRYVMAHYNDTTNCVLPTSGQLMPLSNDKTALINKVKNLTAAGGTAGHLGTAWAWYTLSTNWNTLWPTANQAAPTKETAGLKKYAVLMTDGEYNTEYDTNGVKVGSKGAGTAVNGTSTDQARALCEAMKTAGVIVYTVGFDVGDTGTAADTLNKCATDKTKYYNADNSEELKQAYMDIALKLSSLYLSR